ncbi:hypothetical protein [Nitrospira sp. Nam80]
MAQKAGKIRRAHGASDYKECAEDDFDVNSACRFHATSSSGQGRP